MKNLNCLILSLFCTGILCLGIKFCSELIDATKTTVTKEGILHEPSFFLIPMGYFFLITGILLSVVKLVMKSRERRD